MDELREKVDDIVSNARNEAYQAGSTDTNMDLIDYTSQIMSLFTDHAADIERRAKIEELKAIRSTYTAYSWDRMDRVPGIKPINEVVDARIEQLHAEGKASQGDADDFYDRKSKEGNL